MRHTRGARRTSSVQNQERRRTVSATTTPFRQLWPEDCSGFQPCFDARRCFAEAGEVADLDREACTLPLAGRDPARLNLALASDSAGVCLEAGRCVVPLDRGVSYVVDRGEVQLPRGVCKAIVATGKAKLLASVACAPKVITQPLCPD